MFPIQDSVHSRSVPVVTRALILTNALVFFFELMLPPHGIAKLVEVEFPAAFRAARFGESAQVVSAKRTQHVGCVRSQGLGGFHDLSVYRGDMDDDFKSGISNFKFEI